MEGKGKEEGEMTEKEIERRIEDIKDCILDPEIPHVKEDQLMYDFVVYISQRKDSIGRKARMILEVKELCFPRWCA